MDSHKPHPDFGHLQRVVDATFRTKAFASRLDAIIAAEALDVNEELLEIVELLPPGTYHRQAMCDQLNSALVGHGWGYKYGTVD